MLSKLNLFDEYVLSKLAALQKTIKEYFEIMVKFKAETLKPWYFFVSYMCIQ